MQGFGVYNQSCIFQVVNSCTNLEIMIIVENGRIYKVRNFKQGYQEVKFTRKRYDGSFADGTTVEELLHVLKHKFYHFQGVNPSDYNEACINHVREMLYLCEQRLEEKKKLNEVRGENIQADSKGEGDTFRDSKESM
jgi:hypothetical protein